MPHRFDLQALLRSVFAPQSGERVLVLVDRPHGQIQWDPNGDWAERRKMALEWADGFRQLSASVRVLEFDATGTHGLPLPAMGSVNGATVRIEAEIVASNIVLAFTQFSATSTLGRLVRAHSSSLRGASLPGVLRRMEQSALAADYRRVATRAHELAKELTDAIAASVDFPTGHTMRFDLRHRVAKADDGRCDQPGMIINLPSGEAFSVPYEGEEGEPSETAGNIPWVGPGGDLAVLKVLRNRIVDVSGSNMFANDRRAYFAADRGRRNVAELGIGCNDAAVVTGNTLEDEKAGLHWAYGLSYYFPLGVVTPEKFDDPKNAVHQDVVYAKGCPIHVTTITLHYASSRTKTLNI